MSYAPAQAPLRVKWHTLKEITRNISEILKLLSYAPALAAGAYDSNLTEH